MRELLDENLPIDLRHFLPGHEVVTVSYLGWKGIDNGKLLAKAAECGFQVVLTKDAGIEYEHDLSNLPVAVVVICSKSNALEALRPLVSAVLQALESIAPKTLVRVGDRPLKSS